MRIALAAAATLFMAAGASARGEPEGGSTATPLADATVLHLATDLPSPAFDHAIARPRSEDMLGEVKGMIRHRFASAMIDLYPVSESGFRFSVGTRFFLRQNFLRDMEIASGGLLYGPRLPRGAPGIRSGFRRYVPAATLGYTRPLAPGMMIGIEAGALSGRAVAGGPRGARLGARREDRQRLNPIANLTFGWAF